MPGTSPDVEAVARLLLWISVRLALTMTAIVVIERTVSALLRARRQYIEERYSPLVRRVLGGDDKALAQIAAAPARHRLSVAKLIVGPLIDDRDPVRIARTRAIVRALSIVPIADRYLRSWLWWRRAIALRAIGLLQLRDRTPAVVAALDDAHPDVRGAALDALADLRDVAALPAVVVRLHDASLHHGRRLAALAAFGPECEAFLLDLSQVDDGHLLNYARALAICGTRRSRPSLARWAHDPRPDVRAAAFEAFAHVGVDAEAAQLAIEALESGDAPVRAMAAYALHGWNGGGDAATHLAQHLDDAWPVAVRAARSLRSMGDAGALELRARASHADLAGLLARQMLSPMGARC
jgi:HEAT repeat protein